MASVQLNQLTKHYGDITAVDDLNLTVEDGEFVVLAGPSGCGKTTILRMIAGLERPSQGLVLIGDQVVNALPPQQRHVGMVFQGHAFYPHLNIQANMEFGLAGRKLSRSAARCKVLDAARLLQLDGLLTRFPNELSGGELQRVALGKTLASDPHVWLLDEPFSHLDTNLRYTLRHELARLRRQVGVTTILVTHDLAEAMSLADRIAILHAGRIQQYATPAEIYDRPCSRIVAESWGHPPINMLTAKITEANGDSLDLVVESGPQQLTIHGKFGQPTKGQRVALGIRPEDVRVREVGKNNPKNALFATVERAERMGADSLLHLRCGACTLTAQMPSRQASALSGEMLVDFDSQHIHLFDCETNVRLDN